MNAILYLYKRSFVNRVKKALRKPVTYVCAFFIIAYAVMMFWSFNVSIEELHLNTPSALTAILTVMAFLFIPSSLISFSKRKGLIFRTSDVHFLFPSPMSPKKILLYAHLRTILMGMIVGIIGTVGGVIWFHMPVWKMMVYFLFGSIIENILEGSLMLLCYGNERLNKKQMIFVQIMMYAIVGAFVVIGIIMYVTEGASIESVLNYLHGDLIQMVPIIGWNIAFLHLLFMGPTTLNIICSVLYLIAAIVFTILAWRMKCTGEYYEDAMKFADDYEEARKKSKKGEVAFVGKKKKYGKASITYKGGFAKALFYRQLLEYKKNRFFIFGLYTLLCLGAGIGMAILGYQGEFGEAAPFVVLGVMAYLIFIFSSYMGKWGKELEKPYTYLIPDTSFRKLWYSTLIEHIRSVIDGCLLTIPVAVVLKFSVIQTVLIIFIYTCIQACKLYAAVMVEAFLGNILGNTGKQFAKLLFEGIVIALSVIAAVIGTIAFSMEAGFIMLICVCIVMTLGMMVVAAMNFDRMETVD